MNAVNLIPNESRKAARPKVPVSVPTLGVIGVLLAAVVAVALYASAAHTVNARRSQLAHLRAGVAAWTAAASTYAPYVTAAQQRSQQLTDIRSLVASRFPWENLLGQVSHLMPPTTALATLQASTAPSGGGSSATTTTGTSPSSSASVPSVQLTGCATSQPVVAETMVRLHRISGVTDVQLSSSSESSSSGSSASSAGGQGSCPFPVQFQISLTFTASAGTAGGAAAPASGAATSASPATPGSSPAASAQASSGSPSTTTVASAR